MQLIPLGKYRHYRGNEYEVIALGYIEATMEPAVVYRALYEARDLPFGTVFIRPLQSFVEEIVVEGKLQPRFTYVTPDSRP